MKKIDLLNYVAKKFDEPRWSFGGKVSNSQNQTKFEKGVPYTPTKREAQVIKGIPHSLFFF